MQAISTGEPPELAQLKQAIGQSFRGMDRAVAALDQVGHDLSQARADCQQARAIAVEIFNGAGPRVAFQPTAFRATVLENEDPSFLKSVLIDAWRKSDWAFAAIQKLAAGATPDEIPGLPQ